MNEVGEVKKCLLLGLAIVLLVSLGGVVGCGPKAVTFPDPNLEAAIREAIDKPEGPIHVLELEGLTSLDASGRDITDLNGLEYCTNITGLELDFNRISDISPLASLTKLTSLSLWRNQISDISPLTSLTNLTSLMIAENPLSPSSVNVYIPKLEQQGVNVGFTARKGVEPLVKGVPVGGVVIPIGILAAFIVILIILRKVGISVGYTWKIAFGLSWLVLGVVSYFVWPAWWRLFNWGTGPKWVVFFQPFPLSLFLSLQVWLSYQAFGKPTGASHDGWLVAFWVNCVLGVFFYFGTIECARSVGVDPEIGVLFLFALIPAFILFVLQIIFAIVAFWGER